MKKLLVAIFCLLFCRWVVAQDEKLTELNYNPKLYYSTKQYQAVQQPPTLLVQKGKYIVSTDTLTLPFIDDFSTSRLPGYKWLENHITDTFVNVFGTCLSNQGVPTQESYFIQDSAYAYSFNTITKQLDSVGLPSVELNFFGPSSFDCFSQTPQVLSYWRPYYRPVRIDSTSGRFLDSVLVNLPLPSLKHIDTLLIAPVIYFAQSQPNTLWVDNYAYINNTYPINPPTIGVATLDGLNEFGFPYNSNTNSYGDADALTSKPIDLSAFSADDSIYFSFFYQGMGLGDYPDKKDSLIVEFRDNSGGWLQVWADTGFSDIAYVRNDFRQVLVSMPQAVFPLTYYHNLFQFRFRNKASLTGSNDHWHIDYVRLDANRTKLDTAISDIAFIYDFPTILKEYTLLPAKQFAGDSDLVDDVTMPIHNMDPNAETTPPATNFTTSAEELYPNPVVLISSPVQTFNASRYSDIHAQPSSEYAILTNNPGWPLDSLVIFSQAAINPNDVLPTNDTLRRTQVFSNIVGYDDGSAERAYGLSGLGIKKFAYEFNLPHQDTLAGFQIMYGQVEATVRDLVFNFYAWDSLAMNDFTFVDAPVFALENRKPLYIDSVNGFATYVLDTPLIFSGKLYFGWAQTDTRSLQVGFDLNSTLGKRHMFIYTNGTWKPSSVSPDGSPMIRLILDGNYQGQGTPNAVSEVTRPAENLQLYPNPTNGWINIKAEGRNSVFNISVINTVGQVVQQEQGISNRFDVSNLPAGVYLVEAKDMVTGKVYHNRLIKTTL